MPATKVHHKDAAGAEVSIDLPLFDISRESPELGKAIVEAAAKHGFLWIVASPETALSNDIKSTQLGDGGYDLDSETVQNMFNIGTRFFKDASAAEKAACAITKNRGFVDMHVENLDPKTRSRGDFKQGFNLVEPDFATDTWQQPLPPQFAASDVEAALRDFHRRCRNLAIRLLRLIAVGLEIGDAEWFVRSHEKSPNTLRFLFYPKLPVDNDYDAQTDIRAGAHSDYGSITLLFTRPNQPGLEIMKQDGQWARVPVMPLGYHDAEYPPIVVNIGDILSFWTNGLLKSTIHRVVLVEEEEARGTERSKNSAAAGGDRFSIAIFVQPRDDTVLVPVPSKKVQDIAIQFKKAQIGKGGGSISADEMSKMTAGDHLAGRLKATYGSLYQENK